MSRSDNHQVEAAQKPGLWQRFCALLRPADNVRDVRYTRLSPAGGLSGLFVPRTGTEPLVDRFAGVLSVLYEDPDRGVFLLNGGGETPACGLARVYEMHPALACDEAMAANLERMLRLSFPPQTTIAVTLFASSRVRSLLSEFIAGHSRAGQALSPASAEVLSRMAIRRAELMDALSRGADAGRARGHAASQPVRQFRVWVSLTCRVGADAIDALAAGEVPTSVKTFIEACDAVAAGLRQFGLLAYRWRADDYLVTQRELLNPHLARAAKLTDRPADAMRPLRDQIVVHDTMIDIDKGTVRFSSPMTPEVTPVMAVAVGVSGYPAMTHVNAMGGMLGAAARAGAVLAEPYLFSAVLEPTDLREDRAAMAVKNARVKQLRQTEIGQFLTDLAERGRDFDLAQKACENGVGLARMTHEMVVFAPAGRAGACAQTAKAVLAQAGFDGEVDLGLQMMGMLLTLPMEAGIGLMHDARAARHASTKTRTAAAHMLPVIGEMHGCPVRVGEMSAQPMLLLVTRRGSLFGVDLFANRNGNYNAVIVGTSGSGKSVLAQEVVLSMLAAGGRVWVFDIGRSYKNCVELAQGQWIDFDTETGASAPHLCINPLDMIDDPADMADEIAQIITVMANGDAPMEMTEAELLKLAIARTVKAARAEGRTPTITDLTIDLMGSEDSALASLAVRLMPYAAGGRWARWFEGPANVDFHAALVALEMESLTNKPVLQQTVLLILIMRILQTIRKSPRSTRKLIVIDEAWRLLSGNAGRFIEWACRTLRKYGAGIVCITQSMEDFAVSGTARAVRMNADTVMMLRQKAQSIAAYTDNPAIRQELSELTTESETFSEVWVKVGDAPGVTARLVLDRFSMTAYSTRADVFEAVRKARAAGLSAVAAIEAVARRELV